MSNKKLLSEGTIRRFMKLASIDSNLTSNFVKKTTDPELEVDYNLFLEAMEDDPAPEEEEAGMSLEGDEAMSEEGGMSEEDDMGMEDDDLDMEDDDLDMEDHELDMDAEGEEDGDVTMTDEEVEAFISFGQKLKKARDEGGELDMDMEEDDLDMEEDDLDMEDETAPEEEAAGMSL